MGASTNTSSCQFVPTPKSEIFGKTIPSPAFTLASFNIAAYSLAFKTSIVLTTS